jgi:hypothetical protein
MEGEQAGGKASKWLKHVKKTMKANKGKSLKQVLKMAKKTYKGGADPYEAPSTAASVEQSGGKRHRDTKKTRRGRKGSRKH